MQMHTSGPSRVAPLGPRRFALQVTIEQSTHDKLRYAQQLLGHQVPTGDIAKVLDRALDALISRLEKRKFAAAHKVAGEEVIPWLRQLGVRLEEARRAAALCDAL